MRYDVVIGILLLLSTVNQNCIIIADASFVARTTSLHQPAGHYYHQYEKQLPVLVYSQQEQKNQKRANSLVRLNSSNNNNNNNNSKTGTGKVQFSTLPSTLQTQQQQQQQPMIDIVLSFLVSDIGSIGLGVLGILLLLIGKSFGESSSSSSSFDLEATAFETRTNLLAFFACSSVLLNGITKLDVTSALAESVTLEGTYVEDHEKQNKAEESNPYPIVLDPSTTTMSETVCWAMQSIMKATPAKTVLLLRTNLNDGNDVDTSNPKQKEMETHPWEIIALLGVVPSSLAQQVQQQQPIRLGTTTISGSSKIVTRKMALLDRYRQQQPLWKETYLPTLQALPAKFEFTTYLPQNTQEVVLFPIVPLVDSNSLSSPSSVSLSSVRMVLVVGSNRAKSFTPRDLSWCTTVTKRLSTLYGETL